MQFAADYHVEYGGLLEAQEESIQTFGSVSVVALTAGPAPVQSALGGAAPSIELRHEWRS